jgi:FkbM family methyltransferase
MALIQKLTQLVDEIKIVSAILASDQFYRWLFSLVLNIPGVIKTGSLGIVDRAFGDYFTIEWGQKKLHFDNLDFGVAREIYGHWCYAKPGDLKDMKYILDLGANAGAFTMFSLVEAPQAQVHAVEAQAHFIDIIQQNVDQNGCLDRLSVETAMVGGFHNTWAKEQSQKNPSLQEFNIQAYLKKVGWCDFLKCDVEGGEFGLFQGDLAWLKSVGKMVIEYHPEWGSVGKLEDVLTAQGFAVRHIPHGCLGYFYCSRDEL